MSHIDGPDVARYPNLTKRGSRYYFRRRVPAELREIEGREEIVFSLDTSDPREAVRRYRTEQARVQRQFDVSRAKLSARDATTVALHKGQLANLSDHQLEAMVREWFQAREHLRLPRFRPGEEADVLQLLEEDASHLDAPDAARTSVDALLIAAGAPSVRRRFGAGGPAIDRTSKQYQHLQEVVGRALRAENQIAQDFVLGRPVPTNAPLFQDGNTAASLASPAQLTVAQLISRYRAERERAHGRESTDRKYNHVFRALEEALGADKIVRDISKDDCRAVRDFLCRVPSNASKRFPKLSLAEAIKAADTDQIPRLSPTTVASYMNNLSAVMNWAVDEGLAERNPAKRLVVQARAQVRRRGFTHEELTIIFMALAPMRSRHPHRFWVPALAAFTGARAGELCQLRVSDIIEAQGVWCLDFSEFDVDGRRVRDKSLKTAASERLLPVHPQLLEAGFMAYVEKQAQAGAERLFPGLSNDGEGSYSHELSKWFGRFLDSVGLTQPALVLHSFRHGFRDVCRAEGIPEETSLALGGWATSNVAARYGDRGMVLILNRAMKKLRYSDFCLADFTSKLSFSTEPSLRVAKIGRPRRKRP